MKAFFIADRAIAQALAPRVNLQPAVVANYGLNSEGGLVSGFGPADGVLAVIAEGQAIEAYLSSLSGDLKTVQIESDGTYISAQALVSQTSANGFSLVARQVEALVAQDVAAIYAHPTSHNIPINRASLLMAARSAIRAQNMDAPVHLRAGYSKDDVVSEHRSLPYARYFSIEDMALRHPCFDGGQSDLIHRAVLRSADAVTVLPYDPALDQILLVEQFRPGAYARGDQHPWVLEPVAGRCDADEPVEEVAAREMQEEAGLPLKRLEKIGQYYPSPGAMTEYLYSFVGLVDLSNHQAAIHGLDTEGEDIKTHILEFDQAMALLQSGEADNGPLILSLYWLAANRTRLRQGAGIA